jgi:hypothetical protein
MSKLPMNLQPLKNVKFKYLFGDKIPKGNCAFNSHIHIDVLLLPFVVEHQCEIMDLVLAQKKCTLTKKRKKAYEMNRHSQNSLVVTLPSAEFVLGFNGKVV